MLRLFLHDLDRVVGALQQLTVLVGRNPWIIARPGVELIRLVPDLPSIHAIAIVGSDVGDLREKDPQIRVPITVWSKGARLVLATRDVVHEEQDLDFSI